MIGFLNSMGNTWLQFFLIFELQNTIFILLIFTFLFIFRTYPAKFRKKLTILGLFKTLIPPVLTLPFFVGNAVVSSAFPVFFLNEIAVKNTHQLSAPFINLAGLLFLFWILGVILIFLITIFNILHIRQRVQKTKKIKLDAFSIPEKIDIYFDDSVKSPMVYGCLTPKIILPDTWDKLDKRMQHAILLHEINHIKNGDLWFNIVKVLSTMLHFFNPIHWVLLHYFELFTEMACDDRTVQESGLKNSEYNVLILKAAEGITIPTYISEALGFSRAFQLLRQRIKYQLKAKEINNMKRSKVLRLTVVAVLFLMLIPFSWQCSNQQQEKSTLSAVPKKLERKAAIMDESGVYAFYAVDKKPKMIDKPKPVYPEIARKNGIEGMVVIVVTIGEDGNVIEAVPMEEVQRIGPNGENLGMKKVDHIPELEPAAVEAAKKCTFEPAEKSGIPVKVKMAIPYRFRLQ